MDSWCGELRPCGVFWKSAHLREEGKSERERLGSGAKKTPPITKNDHSPFHRQTLIQKEKKKRGSRHAKACDHAYVNESHPSLVLDTHEKRKKVQWTAKMGDTTTKKKSTLSAYDDAGSGAGAGAAAGLDAADGSLDEWCVEIFHCLTLGSNV